MRIAPTAVNHRSVAASYYLRTCCTASDEHAPFQLRYGLPATVGIAAIAALLSLATSGGNLLVIAAFRIDAQLQRVSNYFLLSLAVADFAIGAVSMPLFTVYLLLGRWPLGNSPSPSDCSFVTFKTKFHYASWFGPGSKPVRSRFGASPELVRS